MTNELTEQDLLDAMKDMENEGGSIDQEEAHYWFTIREFEKLLEKDDMILCDLSDQAYAAIEAFILNNVN